MPFKLFGKRNKDAIPVDKGNKVAPPVVKSNKVAIPVDDGSKFQWPRIWIMIIGIILIFLCFSIAGMEIGNTFFDVRRGTTFGGFILFIPLLACGVIVLVTAFVPRPVLRLVAVILCFIIIFLLLVLIAYDLVVVVDPTRCLFFDCGGATISTSNATGNFFVSGYPVPIGWPSTFQTYMNAKRIFQSIQMFCACLYILFTTLYILTSLIYLRINFYRKKIYDANQRTLETRETSRYSNDPFHSYSQNSSNHLLTTYTIGGPSSTLPDYRSSPLPRYRSSPISTAVHTRGRQTTKRTTYSRPRANSVNFDRICTRCLREPRMVLTTNYERQNYFSHLCVNCNNDILTNHHKAASNRASNNRVWKG